MNDTNQLIIMMMMNGTSSLNRKQAMSPVIGQQQQQSQAGLTVEPADGSENIAPPGGDGGFSRHQMHNNNQNGAANGSSPGSNVDGPGMEENSLPRRHQIMPPCPLEKPPRGKNFYKRCRGSLSVV